MLKQQFPQCLIIPVIKCMRTRIKPNLYLSRKLVEGVNKSERGNHLLSYLNSDMYKLQVITNVRRNQIDMFVLYSIFYLTFNFIP